MSSGNPLDSMKSAFMMKRRAGPLSPPPTPPPTQFQIYAYCVLYRERGGGGGRIAAQSAPKIK